MYEVTLLYILLTGGSCWQLNCSELSAQHIDCETFTSINITGGLQVHVHINKICVRITYRFSAG